jgi:FkbM family methyltransferase
MAFRFKTLHQITTHPLTRKDPVAALKRYFLFHVSQRLFPYPQLYPWIGPLKLLIRRGWAGVVGNIYTGLYDFDDMAFLIHFLKKDEYFLDVGANLGVYSLLAAGICQASVTAIEPIPETFDLLKTQIQLNQLGHLIEAHQVGIGSQPGELVFSTTLGTMNHVVSAPHQGVPMMNVPVQMLDQLIERPVHLLKIDTEGFELPVLQGCSICLSNPQLQAIIIELNKSGERYGYSDQVIDELLRAQGFSPYRYWPLERRLEALKRWRSDQHNTLYLRQPEKVMSKIQSAPRLRIFEQEF